MDINKEIFGTPEQPERYCTKCKSVLEQQMTFDVFTASPMYCKNEKCGHFGLLTLAYSKNK